VPQVLQVGKGDVWFGSGDKFSLTLGWIGSHQHHQGPVRQCLQHDHVTSQPKHPLYSYNYHSLFVSSLVDSQVTRNKNKKKKLKQTHACAHFVAYSTGSRSVKAVQKEPGRL